MIAAVIPVKRLSDAKSRLSAHLSEFQRAQLVLALLHRTIGVLHRVDTIDRVAVVTEERELVDSVIDVDWLPDPGGLNPSLTLGAEWAIHSGARSLLIVPCDLPLLQEQDIRALLDVSGDARSVGIAPTRDGGTGALLLSPPDILTPLFGPDSFRRHLAAARAAAVPIWTVRRTGFLRELDTVEDLTYFDARAIAGITT